MPVNQMAHGVWGVCKGVSAKRRTGETSACGQAGVTGPVDVTASDVQLVLASAPLVLLMLYYTTVRLLLPHVGVHVHEVFPDR